MRKLNVAFANIAEAANHFRTAEEFRFHIRFHRALLEHGVDQQFHCVKPKDDFLKIT